MQAIGYSLGSDGSTSYKTEIGMFDLYPHSNGNWSIYRTPLGAEAFTKHYEVETRRQAIDLIDTLIAIHRI